MTLWARFQGDFPTHPKVVRLTDGAFRLHASGICYCAQYLTDGIVPREVVATLVPTYDPKDLTALVKAGLWVKDDREAAYRIHDYLEWNRSRAQINRERDAKSAGGRRGAKARWT